jgi:branched-chain amino acid transport system substrate-binding protein
VQAVGSLDQQKLADYLHANTFKTIVGDISFAQNGEWATPRVLQIQFQGVRGNELEQFKKAGTQVIVYPESLASGHLTMPYAER